MIFCFQCRERRKKNQTGERGKAIGKERNCGDVEIIKEVEKKGESKKEEEVLKHNVQNNS